MVSNAERELVMALKQIMTMYGIELNEEIIVRENGEELADYSEVISKTQAKIDELNQKAEEIYKRTGMSREQILQYAANPNNFTKAEWEALEQVRQACDQMKQETNCLLEKPQKQLMRQAPRAEKGQKQMRKFAKKKNWLSS